MSFFGKKEDKEKRQWKITRSCLDLILECSKSNYPNEFGGLLRVNPDNKDIIHEIVILPGTVAGESHAIFKLHMKPIDFTIVGTVHSHPSPSPHPSDADLHLFQKQGKIHIIAAMPYDKTSWKAYDYKGEEIEMSVV
jgi:proteasome lid subunit RPN8/RPN11